MKLTPVITAEASPTIAINSLALQKKAAGERVYNLSAGEPMLPPHPAIVAAAQAAITEGKTLYTPAAGIPELRAAAAEWLKTNYAATYSPEEVLVTCGGKFGLFACLQTFISKGDQVLIPAPYWVSYPSLVTLFKGEPVIVPTLNQHDWKVTPEQLEERRTRHTKFVIINNGGNPTGVLYSRQELKNILLWAVAHDVMVISDEVYSGLTFDGREYVSMASFSGYKENCIIIQSCSKHFAMTGWRVGFVFASTQIIGALSTLQSQSTTGTSSISQWAAVGAFQNSPSIIEYVRSAVCKRRDVFVTTFNSLFQAPITAPAAGLYCFIPLAAFGSKWHGSLAFCHELITKANIALVPGAAFGNDAYVRASFGASEQELIESLQALRNYLYT